ncbi:hypothetical protein [Lysinibacillus sp. RC79]|uniref:hypothetical protein n=1 Tax=Lysinibacillus sp. RC79 TaxID=3156296 RepID=UPI0035111DAA
MLLKQAARDAERLLEMEQNIDPDRLFGHGGHYAYVILDGRAEKPFLIFCRGGFHREKSIRVCLKPRLLINMLL